MRLSHRCLVYSSTVVRGASVLLARARPADFDHSTVCLLLCGTQLSVDESKCSRHTRGNAIQSDSARACRPNQETTSRQRYKPGRVGTSLWIEPHRNGI